MSSETKGVSEASVETLVRVLEQFAFMFADRETARTPTPEDGALLVASIQFQSDAPGCLTLGATMGFAVALAGNALGVDLDDEEASNDATDAFKEFLNLLCGHFISDAQRLTQGLIDISPPVVATVTCADWQAFAAKDDTISFMVDGEFPLLMRYDGASSKQGW